MTRVARNREEGRVIGGRVYRGHASVDWPLSSKFERWLHGFRTGDPDRPVERVFGPSGSIAFENGYLSSFKDVATGIPGFDPDGFTDDDWWVLGRHHGLITRLLDWTWSPYVAAFFAFASRVSTSWPGFDGGVPHAWLNYPTDSVVVWALAPFRDIFVEGEFEFMDGRRASFHRQRAQYGVFTRLRHDTFLDVASYLEHRGVGHFLERIEIPACEMGKALHDLRLMTISFGTMFPDLDGASKEANLRPLVSKICGSGIMLDEREPRRKRTSRKTKGKSNS